MVDYEGQRLGELIFHILIISFGSVGWLIGYMRQDFTVCVQAWLVGVVLSVIVSERDDDADDDRCNSIRTVER
jgi:signal peptidase complex subunit 1